MRIKTTSLVNTHLQDGREVAAAEGDVVEIPDEDAAMVGLARSLIMSGQAQHYGDAGGVDEEAPTAEETEVADEETDDSDELDEDDED